MWKRRNETSETHRLWRAVEEARTGQVTPPDPTAELLPLLAMLGDTYSSDSELGPEDASLSRLRAAIDTDESLRLREFSRGWGIWSRVGFAAGWAATILAVGLFAHERGRNDVLESTNRVLATRVASVQSAPPPVAPVQIQEVPKKAPRKKPDAKQAKVAHSASSDAKALARRNAGTDSDTGADMLVSAGGQADEEAQSQLADRARVAVGRGDWEGAIRSLDLAVAAAPQSERSLDALETAAKICSEKLRDPQRAVEYYERLGQLARDFISRTQPKAQEAEPLRQRVARAVLSVGNLRGDTRLAQQGVEGTLSTSDSRN